MAKPIDTPATPDIGISAVKAAMMAVNPATAQAMMSVMAESARFLTDRLQQDLDAQKALLACKSPTELMQVQAGFMKTAMEQYMAYAVRFQKAMTTATADTMENARTGHSRGYDDVPI